MLGRNWCGSGGCSTLVLTQKDGSWKQVAEVNLSFPAIYMLPDVSHGWHSIAVWTRDMRDNPTGGYEVALRFDGKTYPGNTNFGSRLRGKPVGKLLIASMKDSRNEATLLYGE